MAQPTSKVLELLQRALGYYRGDDLYRAKAHFRGCTPEQMQEQYGESGKTRQQLLDEYEAHEKLCDQAQAYLANSTAVLESLKKLSARVIEFFPKGEIEAFLDSDIEVRQFARDAQALIAKVEGR